jgi:diacylglycerol O-acyltransferase
LSGPSDDRAQRYERARRWGTATEMNPLEALMWRAEADSRLRSTIAAVEVLDCIPDWERLRAAHEWGSRMVPRFRQRVVEPALGIGLPAWEDAPGFELSRHVRRERLPAGGGMRSLLDLAAAIVSAPFDRDQPLWEAVLVEGLGDGQAGYILKLHHSLADGLGNVQLLEFLHSDRREPTPDKPYPPLPVPRPRGGIELLIAQLAGVVKGAPSEVLGIGRDAVELAGQAATQPPRAVIGALRFAASLERLATSPPAVPSPLLAPRSLKWRFEALGVPLAELRAAGRAASGSLNDAFVAALLGAFRRYHDEFGIALEAIPMAIPVSVRRERDALGGNRFTGLRFAAPVSERDPRRRISRVKDLVTRGRAEPALPAIAAAAPVLGVLPAPLAARLSARMTQTNDLQASNVPGLSRTAYMAGARITHVYPFGPLPGCAAMISLVSHENKCCVGANLDAAAFTEPDLFRQCLVDGFEEVLSLGRSGGPRAAGPVRA